MKITRKSLRNIIREALKKGESGPFGSGMEQAELDPEEKELIGHQ